MTKRDSTHERRPRGFYPTPWAAFAPLIPHLSQRHTYAEPCAGDGALCNHLANAGFHVGWASDIVPNHPLVAELDALSYVPSPLIDMIVTNPPWPEPRCNGAPTLSILKNLSRIPTWMLLPADFMHNVYAAEAMARCQHIVSVGRVKWIADSDHQGFDNAAWYLFYAHKQLDGHLMFSPRVPAAELRSQSARQSTS